MKGTVVAAWVARLALLAALVGAAPPEPEKPGEIRISSTGHCLVSVDAGAPTRLRPGGSAEVKLAPGTHLVRAESSLTGLQREYPIDVPPGQKLTVAVDLVPLAREKLGEKGVAFDKSAFLESVASARSDVVGLFLDSAMSPDEKDPQEWPVLVRAASLGHAQVAKLLLEAGAEVDGTTPKGRTAAMWAAQRGHPLVMRELVAAGANLNKKDKILKDTALMLAAAWGHAGIVEALAQVSEGKKSGVVRSMIKVFDKGRLDLDATNRMGWNALMYAARSGETAIAQVLVEAGAETDHRDELKRSALDLARAAGHKAAADYLQGVESQKRK